VVIAVKNKKKYLVNIYGYVCITNQNNKEITRVALKVYFWR
jgi:hypothetical protein